MVRPIHQRASLAVLCHKDVMQTSGRLIQKGAVLHYQEFQKSFSKTPVVCVSLLLKSKRKEKINQKQQKVRMLLFGSFTVLSPSLTSTCSLKT